MMTYKEFHDFVLNNMFSGVCPLCNGTPAFLNFLCSNHLQAQRKSKKEAFDWAYEIYKSERIQNTLNVWKKQ